MMVVPVELEDPLQRVRAVHNAAVDAKETHYLMGPELVSRWSAYFPRNPSRRRAFRAADGDREGDGAVE